MKKWHVFIIFWGLCVAQVQAEIPWNETVRDLNGQPASLQPYQGRVIWLDFWASWCLPCRESFPWLNRMQETYGKQGFSVVAVNVDRKASDAERFLNRYPANFDVLHDPEGKLAEAMQVKGMPMGYLIDSSGRVVLRHVGFRAEDGAKLGERISEIVEMTAGNQP